MVNQAIPQAHKHAIKEIYISLVELDVETGIGFVHFSFPFFDI